MKIASDDIAGIITAATGFIVAIAGSVTSIVILIRQNRKAEEHNTAIRSDIAELKAVTGNYKTLSDTKKDGP